MTDFLVSYDLMKEQSSEGYKKLWDELKRLGAQKTQFSLWLVNMSGTAKEVHNHFKGFVDSDDRIWVAEVVKNHHFSNAIGGTNAWLEKNPPGR